MKKHGKVSFEIVPFLSFCFRTLYSQLNFEHLFYQFASHLSSIEFCPTIELNLVELESNSIQLKFHSMYLISI